MRHSLLFILIWLFLGIKFSVAQDVRYSVPEAPWEESYGNHRAVIQVDQPGDAVHLQFLWRRHDLSPEKHRMLIIHADSGDTIRNIYRVRLNNELCELVFGPAVRAGTYYFYYLPYAPERNMPFAGKYLLPEPTPDQSWVLRHHLTDKDEHYKKVGKAVIKEIQSRSSFDNFYPMEVSATHSEMETFLKRNKDDYLIFPEDRSYPIRMDDALPLRWVEEKPEADFQGTAQQNEYYVFQLGIYASRKNVKNIRLEFSDLRDSRGNTISGEAFTCFNTDGTDSWGKAFSKEVNIDQEKVQALWVGIDIPGEAVPGTYEGYIDVKPANLGKKRIKIQLMVMDHYLADRGDGEPWRHSRLRWLNSTLGLDDKPVHPYTPLKATGKEISCLGRSVQLNDHGMPEQINSHGHNILSLPVNFVVESDNQRVIFPAGDFIFKEKKDGFISWESVTENNILKIACKGEMEYDGRLGYQCTVTSKKDLHIQDIRIEIPLKKQYATYMVGMGRMGGLTPKEHLSRWIETEDSFWIGSASGGIHCELRGGSYHGPLLYVYKPAPPSSWENAWNGGYRIRSCDSTVTASAYSGYRKMKAGESVNYEFALLITPVKTFNLKGQFTNRYFHDTEPTKEVLANGGNVMNVHHATAYNPYINYPFLEPDKMRAFVDQWHTRGWKVKFYYTVRELTTRLPELWALRSLDFEVLTDGAGGGYAWLQEHLVKHYTVQWYNYLGEGKADAAILTSSESRWYNYYIEGLAWLIKNMDIDGLYLDDVAFDRHILKRMRRVMDMSKPGCMIDLHSNTGLSKGPVNQYAEFFPYIDKTWFGEGFNYDIMPADFWFVELSGMPMGIGNDMLLHMSDSNRRGMVFGMTQRGFFPMWKLWDSFGISTSEMSGFWDDRPAIITDQKDVYATAYIKQGRTLVTIGNWADKPVKVRLNIDWKRLGLDPSEINIVAPAIEGCQQEKVFNAEGTFPLSSKQDLLLVISKKGQGEVQ
ncbi:MAG: glycoside hydrolase domain-containing protein [Mangrovibacterium sp.]